MVKEFNPVEYSICFSAPKRIAPHYWAGHIPFAMFLMDILRPKVFVELGTYYGVSHCAFCQAVKELRTNTRCYAIDTWQGDGITWSYDANEVLEDLMRHHDPLYGNFSRLIRGTFDDTVNSFHDGEIDLLHIDGFHQYESVKHDFETWLPKMSKKGVILFHDINVRQKDYGVWKLWDEIKPAYLHFEFMHEHGLGVLAVGPDVPDQFREMFLEQDEQSILEIRNFFFKIGNVWKPLFDVAEKERKIKSQNDNLGAEIGKMRDELYQCQLELRSLKESRTYRLANKIRLLSDWIAPQGSFRRRLIMGNISNASMEISPATHSLQETSDSPSVSQRDNEQDNVSFWTTRTLHHQPQRISGQYAITEETTNEPDDAELIQKLIDAYTKASRDSIESQGSIWHEYITIHNKATHAILVEGDMQKVAKMLRNPADSMLFYGFDGLAAFSDTQKMSMDLWPRWRHLQCYDNLLRLAEIVGVARLQHPEVSLAELEAASVYDVEVLLHGLDDAFGFHIDFPNLFPKEIGIATSRGVASYRAIQALYQAYRINTLLGNNPVTRVLEIGAGLGRTAYYSAKFGVSSYTIVDLPLVNVVQGYFLGRTQGEKHLQLFGGDRKDSLLEPKFRIFPQQHFFSDKENYDLIICVDALTEMSKVMADNYFNEISQLTPYFLSINHEYNKFTFREIYLNHKSRIGKIARALYPMRRGYVEEVIEFSQR